ncbi:UNVERIFIED_CONTAM: hypothetical protein HDU68_009161 [Siphonaria sp. JEL0065]|nr:hypothetical protein HDU68_009161 [Siphonaria sp. JEL0065]
MEQVALSLLLAPDTVSSVCTRLSESEAIQLVGVFVAQALAGGPLPKPATCTSLIASMSTTTNGTTAATPLTTLTARQALALSLAARVVLLCGLELAALDHGPDGSAAAHVAASLVSAVSVASKTINADNADKRNEWTSLQPRALLLYHRFHAAVSPPSAAFVEAALPRLSGKDLTFAVADLVERAAQSNDWATVKTMLARLDASLLTPRQKTLLTVSTKLQTAPTATSSLLAFNRFRNNWDFGPNFINCILNDWKDRAIPNKCRTALPNWLFLQSTKNIPMAPLAAVKLCFINALFDAIDSAGLGAKRLLANVELT